MKGLYIIAILLLLPGCSIFLPEILDGTAGTDADLAGVLFINEISANNPDAADWVELYNSSDKPVNLAGFHLSDNPAEAAKWSFPGGTYLPAGAYLIITCDTSGANLSTGFGLAPGTDQVVLTSPDLDTLIDLVPTIPLTGSGSYGRETDGADVWITFTEPTPGEANS